MTETLPLPSVAEQRASFATWSSAPLLPGATRPKDQKAIEYINKLISQQQRISQIGEQPVTIVNLNPYILMVNNPLFDGLNVKANKSGDKFSALVITSVKTLVNQGVDDNHTPEEFWPIQLAQEFDRQYSEKGGCFYIKGNLETNPELAHTVEFKEKLHQAYERLFEFAFSRKQKADAAWNKPGHAGAAQQIGHTERQMAQLLFDARKIPKLPEWMNELIATDDILPQCPICKSEPKKGALICVSCNEVLDPAGAFLAKAISETHHSLEKLTRKQVEDLGCSAYVSETRDERPERLKRGMPKPFSLFEKNQAAALKAETKVAPKAKE